MSDKSVFTQEQKTRIVKEALATGKIKATAIKHDMNVGTLYSWVKTYKNHDLKESINDTKSLKKQISDLELENQVLKELLKKTTLTLIKD
jgi:transposase-like protein